MKLESIIAPLTILLVMIPFLVAGRFYDRLPVKLPPCGFKKVTGLPCFSCRGTRSIQALARGDIALAVRYNPLAIAAVGIGFAWIAGYVVRRGRPPARRLSPRIITVTIVVLLAVNWAYLLCTNGQFP